MAVVAALAALGGVSMLTGCADGVGNTVAKSGTYQASIAASDGAVTHIIPVTVIIP